MFKRTPTRFLPCVTRKIMGTPARRENTGKDQLCEEDREVMLGGGGTVDTSESTKWRCAVCTVTVLVWSPESPPGFMSESLWRSWVYLTPTLNRYMTVHRGHNCKQESSQFWSNGCKFHTLSSALLGSGGQSSEFLVLPVTEGCHEIVTRN